MAPQATGPRRGARTISRLIIGLCLAGIGPAAAQENENAWNSLRPDVFGSREVGDGSGALTLEAPTRAEDAAIVPISIKALPAPSAAKSIKAVTLIIDENPAPVAARFTFGPAAANASISTRLRVNSYSFVRAVAELNDGSLAMVKRYVKAAGGCSAPALKDQDQALADLGKLKLKQFSAEQGGGAQLMIHHPNYSGLQMNQLTQLYIPARYVSDIEIARGAELLLKMEGGISLSENPTFRFSFRKGGAGDISVRARDTEGKEFTGSWTVEGSGS
jgi:sulfur-oxidizing protein SoxY